MFFCLLVDPNQHNFQTFLPFSINKNVEGYFLEIPRDIWGKQQLSLSMSKLENCDHLRSHPPKHRWLPLKKIPCTQPTLVSTRLACIVQVLTVGWDWRWLVETLQCHISLGHLVPTYMLNEVIASYCQPLSTTPLAVSHTIKITRWV